MPHQLRSAAEAGDGPLNASMDYEANAAALGSFYESHLTGAARVRISALRRLSVLLRCDGVLQVDACPFHSRSLPTTKKLALLDTLGQGGLLAEYVHHVADFLRARPVVIVAAISSQDSLQSGVPLTPWLTWKAGLAGLDTGKALFVPLLEKNGKVTSAALVGQLEGNPKALVLRWRQSPAWRRGSPHPRQCAAVA